MFLENRQQAGELLAERLATRQWANCLVLGIPRGGIVVAAPLAQRLGAPLDILVTRKVVLPDQPELALGAVAPDGQVLWRITPPTGREAALLAQQVEAAHQELERRQRVYRGVRPAPGLRGRTVILVDDGLATGFSALAALRYLARAGASPVVLAVPVGPVETVQELSGEADELVCLATPQPFLAVGEFYRDFDPVSDAEVVELLEENREKTPPDKAR